MNQTRATSEKAGNVGSNASENVKFKQLQDQIEIAEEELALLRKNKGNQLNAQNQSRQCKYPHPLFLTSSFILEIQNRMVEEKNKLKFMHEAVREKQAELANVILYSKI